MWVPPGTEAEPRFLKSNFHLLSGASLYLKAFSLIFIDKKICRGENHWKKIPKCPADLKILPTIANHL